MLLRGREGSELELAIVGYQFPAERFDPWDSNWLLVSVRVRATEGSWEVVDPCLTTWEGAELARWLAAIAHRADMLAARPLSLTEPNLTITAAAVRGEADRVAVRACFALELRPPWLKSAAGSNNLCVDLDVDRAQLARAATDLRADLDRFPQRGDDPTL
ncbi:MAG: WapI family immunity protein [Acidimicrobiales bacterium]